MPAVDKSDECRAFHDKLQPQYGIAQIFFDSEYSVSPSCSEDKSIKFKYQYCSSIQFDLKDKRQRIIRFDPDQRPCICKVNTEGCFPHNACMDTEADGDVFITDDPIYFTAPSHSIEFAARPYSLAEAAAYIERLEECIRELRSKRKRWPLPSLPLFSFAGQRGREQEQR